MSGVVSLLRDLLFPPRCIGCAERMSPCTEKKGDPYFCASCAKKWENDQLAQCPDCYAAYCDCRCIPTVMTRAGVKEWIKLAPYHGDRGTSVTDCVVRGMKKEPRRRSFECCARSLKPLLLSALEKAKEEVPVSHTVIGYLPRAREKVRRYGFDQARELAAVLAKETGLPFSAVLRRVKDGVPQKSLGVQKRRENLRGAFALCRDVKGKRVILVDDLVTTGAGMAEAARVLRQGGAGEVWCVSVAATPKKVSIK